MGIGASVFLLAIGAILTWAVHLHVGWLDLRIVGWILMAAGLLGLILTLWFWNGRRRRITTTPGDRVDRTESEYHPDEDPALHRNRRY